jgi:hypothetical protein
VELPASSRRWVLAVTDRDGTEDMTSRRMIAATVLRELRLLGVINIAIREEWQGRQRL